ncbi:MAG: hypothetical protein KDH15_10630 [Rhodocyclaceae bacterium]|nr:hypothetical protein [Rhodocyclaceae bacterium]
MDAATKPTRPATWLDLVRAASDELASVKLHRLDLCGGDPRLAISLASRVVHSNDGSMTVFTDHAAAARFLALAGIRRWQSGETLPVARLAAGRVQCLGLRGGRLHG